MAISLANACINTSLDFALRTIPPNLIEASATSFDNAFQDLRMAIITPAGATFPLPGDDRSRLADRIASLPQRHAGMGHIKALTKSAPAFYAAHLQCLSDERIWKERHLLWDDLKDAYTRIIRMLSAQATQAGHKLNLLLPTSVDLLP